MLTKSHLIIILILIATAINTTATNPTSGTPYITPTPANTTSNLTCQYNWTDNSAVTNITNWYKNGQPTTTIFLPFDTNNQTNTKEYTNQINTNVSGTTWTSQGQIGGAYQFNGSGIINTSITGNGLNVLTIELWFKDLGPTSITGFNRLISSATSTQEYLSIYASLNPSYNQKIMIYQNFTETAGMAYWESANLVFQNNTWTHLVLLYNRTTNTTNPTLYINSVQKTLTKSLAPKGTYQDLGTIRIGNNGATTRGFNGTIDDVRIYNYLLPTNQIYANYQNGLQGRSQTNYVTNNFAAGDQIKCSVTPNDATADGTNTNSTTITIQSLNEPPTWNSLTNTSSNTTTTKENIKFGVNIQDNLGIHTIMYSDNQTGTWYNKTSTQINALTATINITTKIITNPGTYWCAQFWTNDTENNINQTRQECFKVAPNQTSDNEIYLILIAVLFSYLILYQKNHLLGNIAFLTTGLATINLGTTLTIPIGIIIITGSLASTIYDTIIPHKSNN